MNFKTETQLQQENAIAWNIIDQHVRSIGVLEAENKKLHEGIKAEREKVARERSNAEITGLAPIAQGQVDVNVRELSYSYDLFYDIKTSEQLQNEVEYLAHRVAGIARLCRDDGYSIDDYVLTVMEFPSVKLTSFANSEREAKK